MTYSEGVQQFGLITWTCMEIRRKKLEGGYKPVSQWYAPEPKSISKRKGAVIAPRSAPVELPVNTIIPSGVSAVDDEVELPTDDDPREVGAAPKPIEVGVDDPEDGAQDEVAEQEAQGVSDVE